MLSLLIWRMCTMNQSPCSYPWMCWAWIHPLAIQSCSCPGLGRGEPFGCQGKSAISPMLATFFDQYYFLLFWTPISTHFCHVHGAEPYYGRKHSVGILQQLHELARDVGHGLAIDDNVVANNVDSECL